MACFVCTSLSETVANMLQSAHMQPIWRVHEESAIVDAAGGVTPPAARFCQRHSKSRIEPSRFDRSMRGPTPDADAPARSLYDTVLDLALTRTTKDDALEADDYAAEPIHDPGSTLKEAPKRAAAAKPLTALVSAARGIDTGSAACVTARALRRRPADRRMISAMALAAPRTAPARNLERESHAGQTALTNHALVS